MKVLSIFLLSLFLFRCYQPSKKTQKPNLPSQQSHTNQEHLNVESSYALIDSDVVLQWQKDGGSGDHLEPLVQLFVPCSQVAGLKECEGYFSAFFPKKDFVVETQALLLSKRVDAAKSSSGVRKNEIDDFRSDPRMDMDGPRLSENSRVQKEFEEAVLENISPLDVMSGVIEPTRESIEVVQSLERGFAHLNQISTSRSTSKGSLVLPKNLKKSWKVAQLKIEKALSPRRESQELKALEIEWLEKGTQKFFTLNPNGFKRIVMKGKVPRAELEGLALEGFRSQEVTGKKLGDVDLSHQYELTEAVRIQANRHFKETGKQTVILGHLPETHAQTWGTLSSIDVLKEENWSIESNMKWLQDHIDQGSRIFLGSTPRVYDPEQSDFEPVYHRELRLLLQKNYVRVGSEMIKLDKPSKDFQEQEFLAGVCIHQNCYPTP